MKIDLIIYGQPVFGVKYLCTIYFHVLIEFVFSSILSIKIL